ncbi:MAG: CHAD domain-containing protein [Verrucomicrobiota bacterium]
MNPIDESAAQATRDRLTDGCAAMKRLLTGLLDSKGRVAEEVHSIRKLGKSLRGGLTLFRLGKSAALEIQSIGRLLSGPRDAVSRINTWHKLAWEGDPATMAAIIGLLDIQTHSAARRPTPDVIAWCLQRVDAATNELLALPPAELADRLSKGLKRLKQRACKHCRKLDHREIEYFHETRKALKAWLGAMDYLPAETVGVDPEYVAMVELLGDENDLATLSHWLNGHGFTRRFAPNLWETLEISRRNIQRQVIESAATIPCE